MFDDFPIAEDFCCILGSFFAEDVRMAANHFFVDFADDGGDVEAVFFVGDLGVEKNLEKEVAEFFSKFGVIGAVECIEDFVGFFDEVGAEGGVGLFAVPRTATGCAKAGHDSDEFFERRTDVGGAAGVRFARCASGALGVFPLRFAGSHVPFRKKMSDEDSTVRREIRFDKPRGWGTVRAFFGFISGPRPFRDGQAKGSLQSRRATAWKDFVMLRRASSLTPLERAAASKAETEEICPAVRCQEE